VLPVFKVAINNQTAMNLGNSYLYIDLWSSPLTWGGESPPRLNDTVYIPPGQNVLLDVSTPLLYLISIEGQLIFDNVDLTLDCYFITVTNGGYLQIGTPENPLTSNV
jgi:hypothetical protein